jgi:hypothetical protein
MSSGAVTISRDVEKLVWVDRPESKLGIDYTIFPGPELQI